MGTPPPPPLSGAYSPLSSIGMASPSPPGHTTLGITMPMGAASGSYGQGGAGGNVYMAGGMGGAGTSSMQGGGRGDKKRDDSSGDMEGSWDPEDAAMHGGATTYQPMSGLIRGRGGRCNPALLPLLSVMQTLDKAGLAMYRRPALRMTFCVYLLVLHLVTLTLMI